MTVPLQVPANEYTGNGVTTVFAYSFKLLLDTDLVVDVGGVVKTLGTDYVVTGLGADNGGNVTFTVAPAADALVTLTRSIVPERLIDYEINGQLPAATVNKDFDRIWMAIQDMKTFLPGTTVPFETHVAVGGENAFTLDTVRYTPALGNLWVVLNGQLLPPAVDYALTAPNQVTFVAPLSAGDEVTFIGGTYVPRSSGGGGSGTAAAGGILVADFTIDDVAPATRRWEFPATNPNGWNIGQGRQTVQFNFRFNSFLAANPTAHLVYGLRVDTDVLAVQTRFHGLTLGDLTGAGAGDGAPHKPTTQIETAASGVAPAGIRWMLPNTWGSPSKLLVDGVDYRVILDSTLARDQNRYIRYRLYRANPDPVKQAWDLEYDSGDVLDTNIWLDMTKQGFAIASVFESNLVPWSIDIFDLHITWGPPEAPATDMSASRNDAFDGNLDANLNILGNGRVITVKCNGATLNDYTAVRSNLLNNSTTLVAIPNGTSQAANFLATNRSDRSGAFGYTSIGMNGGNAEWTTLGLAGHPTPPILLKIGGTTHTLNTAGLLLSGATEYIGTATTRLIGPYDYGGPNALAFNGAFSYENVCTVTNIATFLGGAYNAGNLENIIRPLYCYLSQLHADLKARKVI